MPVRKVSAEEMLKGRFVIHGGSHMAPSKDAEKAKAREAKGREQG